MEEQTGIVNKGGTMRLGAYPCELVPDTKLHELYSTQSISERHRHRYEFNNNYRNLLCERGLIISGLSPDNVLVESIELPDSPFFIGVQFHPEFKSRPNKPHPIFSGFVSAANEK
jgi:CTP synthase